MFKRLEKFGRKVRPWVVAEKQHNEMFSVATFALSRKHLVMKRFVLNIVLLKYEFQVVILKTQGKVYYNEKQSTMK